MASDIISRVGKGKPNGVVEAIADTDIAKRVLNSPLAKSTGATLRGIASGAAVPAALAADSVNTGVNAVNQALGGGANLLPANNTRSVINWGMNGSSDKPAAIAGPVPALASPQQPAAAQQTALQSTPAVSSNQPAPAIAGGAAKLPPGVLEFKALGKPTSQAGVSIADGRGSDYSPNSPIAKAATTIDGSGRTYDEQVALAKEVNANTMQQLGNVSAKQKWDQSFVGAADASNPLYRNAMLERKAWAENNANNQAGLARDNAKSIAGITADTHKYTADQGLAGHKYTADANVKAHELTAIGNVEKAKIAGREKQREQGQKDYTDRVKGLVGDWSKLNLPKEYVPKLNEYAKIYAAAEDPQSNTFLMPPNRDGGMYAALPKQYESIYSKLLQTMPHKDAAARIYDVAKKQGHVIDVPDFKRFLPTSDAIKNQNQTMIAGV